MKVNDRVVCIRTASNQFGVGVHKGQIYTIYSVHPCSGCSKIYFNVGLPDSAGTNDCPTCGTPIEDIGSILVTSTHFRPIEYNSATEELANKEIVEEKLDVPVKEPQKEKA